MATAKRKVARRTPKAGPHISTSRAKKTPGKTVKVGGTQVIKAKGKKPLVFKKGALHAQLGIPQDKKIPAAKMAAAKRGDYGPLAKKRANFATGALAKGQRTALKNKRAKKSK